MFRQIGLGALLALLVVSMFTVVSAEEPVTKYNVSLYCRNGKTIKYAVREVGQYELQKAQWKWTNGKVVGYVEAKGAKYLPEAMLEKGYTRNSWSYMSWRERIDFLPPGIFVRGCDVLDK